MQIVCILSSWCHCHPKTPSSLASFKSRLVLPFWYRLIQVVLEKKLLSGCSSSCCLTRVHIPSSRSICLAALVGLMDVTHWPQNMGHNRPHLCIAMYLNELLAVCCRMSLLQDSESRWQLRVPLRESNSRRNASRPVSIADRMSQLSESAQSWTSKVQDKDMKKFTVENKLDRLAGRSADSCIC